MNLRVLKKSRHIPQAGDIFVMQLPDTHYLFGRVINTNANPLGVGEAILIYIYDTQMNTPYPIPPSSAAHKATYERINPDSADGVIPLNVKVTSP